MNVCDVIEAKKRKKILTEEQINCFVRAVADGSASDAQIAAFCMAVLLNGMTDKESALLTFAMQKSGRAVPRPRFPGVCADKHSTGGVSDSTTLVLVPVLASLGVRCAKYSGRGLGHTGGTLDKLESFPGLRTDLTPEQFEAQVERVGAAIAGQTGEIVPADKRMYAVRDVTATIDSIPLIASSVMSKKLASFADVILLDVKCGEGAFMRTPEEAEKLARLMVRIGRQAGRKVSAAVTAMDAPLGDCIGCNAEVREAIEVLKGKENRLSELSFFLASVILRQAEGCSPEEARSAVNGAIASGAALGKLKEIVSAQGGDARAADDFSLLPLAENVREVRSGAEGYLTVSALALGKACAELGGGRKRPEDGVDHTVGIVLQKRAGERVHKGEPLAQIYYREASEEAFALAEGAFGASASPAAAPLVYTLIEED